MKIDTDTWLREHLDQVIKDYAGRYVVIVDDKGVILTDADGTPREIVKKAKAQFPQATPLFFRVPVDQDFLCALILR